MDTNIFLPREISWLDFNGRVLEEAAASGNPMLERLKFIAIFSSNLDEFFMVRIAGLRHLLDAGQDTPDASGERPSVLLKKVYEKIRRLQNEQYRLLREELLPALRSEGIEIKKMLDLSPEQQLELYHYFEDQVLPVLTPVAVDPFHPFPLLNNGAIEIVASIIPHGREGAVHALVEVPESLSRFIPVKSKDGVESYVLLEDVIMAHLGMLFSGCRILELLPFRITRDMDLTVNEDGVEDLLVSLEKTLLQRRLSKAVRLEMPENESRELSEWLRGQLGLSSEVCFEVNGPLHLKQFFELAGRVNRPDLLEEPWPALPAPQFGVEGQFFESIARKPVMIVLPFQSFDPVLEMLNEAARDPDVLAIKQTLYRVSGHSPVVAALQEAAENGKQVTVIVELKARFDEGNNIVWAKKLEESGAHVIYGISGLKIHGKALLVVRRENGCNRRYVHLATGNYNDKTATQYTDIGYFSADPDLCADIAHLFNVMTGYAAPGEWHKIAAAPFDMRKKFLHLIEREKKIAQSGGRGRIIAKMNSLVDSEIIRALYGAASAGVKIDLIVRGICCLRPGVGTNNINVVSIVDRYLEHSRIYCFGNNGKPEYYLSSADWMFRNLDRRIEIMFPVEDAEWCKLLEEMLRLELEDQEKGRRLRNDGSYSRANTGVFRSSRSQQRIYELIRKHVSAGREKKGKILRIFGFTDIKKK